MDVSISLTQHIIIHCASFDIHAKIFIRIAESTVHGLHGPPPTGQSLFTCRVAGDQIELNY